ncbi:type VI secretion system-associated protein TagF [Burkholderia ambifaria]|nr:type VI secretion system-associated protein TagF [Burkholderia ambifaria]
MTVGMPALWGRLPASIEQIRHRTTVAQALQWQHWLTRHPEWVAHLSGEGGAHALPWSFVLTPACSPFGDGRYVVGVMAASCDRAGRRHPCVVSCTVSRRWLERRLREPHGVLFQMARLLARYVPPRAQPVDPDTLASSLYAQLDALWDAVHAVAWPRMGRRGRKAVVLSVASEMQVTDRDGDPARVLTGVPDAPWAAWPRCTTQGNGGWFWQQDDRGGFVDQWWIAGAPAREAAIARGADEPESDRTVDVEQERIHEHTER